MCCRLFPISSQKHNFVVEANLKPRRLTVEIDAGGRFAVGPCPKTC